MGLKARGPCSERAASSSDHGELAVTGGQLQDIEKASDSSTPTVRFRRWAVLKPWDTSAGVVIAREAGALTVDHDGTPHSFEAHATIGANPELLTPILELVSHAMSGTDTRLS